MKNEKNNILKLQLAGLLFGMAALFFGGCAATAPALRDGDFQQLVRTASDQVFPALVYIRVVREEMSGGKNSTAAVSGSGVLISSSGELLTNHHVIEKAASIRCQLNDGRAFTARVTGSDKDVDLALLQLELPPGTPPLPTAKIATRTAENGEFVMAMGAPWGLNRSVSIGIISCARRYLQDRGEYTLWYQTDATVLPGNSGGPLIDTQGEILGINTLGTGNGALAFTVPSSTVLEVLPRLRQYGKANWAWFGMVFQPLRDFDRNLYAPGDTGVIIAATEPGSPARAAGVEPNDRLIAVNGEPVTALTAEALPALRRKLGLFPFGTDVTFTFLRNGEKRELHFQAQEKGKVEGEEFSCPGWDFSVKAINRFDNPELYFYRTDGVFVFGVFPGGNAKRAKLQPRDIILAVNGKEIRDLAQFRAAYQEAATASDGHRTDLQILRNGVLQHIIIKYTRPHTENGEPL